MSKDSNGGYYGIFNDSFPPIMDGVTLTVENYARLLAERGMRPCVVTPRNPEIIATDYEVLRYFSMPIRGRYPYRYGYPKLDFRIHRELRRRPFRIVHAHCPFSSGHLALYTARKQHIPLVGTFHSKYRQDMEHSMRHFPWLVNRVMAKIVAFFEACDEVWIPQAEVEATVREYGYRGPLVVMENGNDLIDRYRLGETTKAEARKRIGTADDELGLLFVGQHIWEKGLRIIIDALKILHGRVKFRMNFVGNGYAAADLKRLIAEYGLEGCVKVNGIIQERERLVDFYAGSDLFVFPSMYDNAPLVVREAAAMGTPALLPTGSTASEVITDNVNGFLTDRSAESYAERIAALAADTATLRKVGLNARKSIPVSWDKVMDQVTDRYKHLINRYR